MRNNKYFETGSFCGSLNQLSLSCQNFDEENNSFSYTCSKIVTDYKSHLEKVNELVTQSENIKKIFVQTTQSVVTTQDNSLNINKTQENEDIEIKKDNKACTTVEILPQYMPMITEIPENQVLNILSTCADYSNANGFSLATDRKNSCLNKIKTCTAYVRCTNSDSQSWINPITCPSYLCSNWDNENAKKCKGTSERKISLSSIKSINTNATNKVSIPKADSTAE